MKNKIVSKLFAGESGGVFKGMLTLLMGAGLAQIVSFAAIPILTRIYSPEDFGALALYTAFVAILAPMLTLRYVQAIPLPKTDEMAFNLFSVCFKLILTSSLVISLVLLFCGERILGWFGMQVLFPWWWLIVLGSMGTALYELFSLWATRKKQYKTIAKTQFAQSVIGNFSKIFLGLLALKPMGLLVGQFFSQSAGIISFIRGGRHDFKAYFFKIRSSRERLVAKYYQGFVWYRLPSQFLMVLSTQAPVMLMAALYDKEVTGQLGLAMMALSLPVGLIGQAMAKAYYAEVASIGNRGLPKIKKITYSVQKKLFVIGLPAAAAVIFFAEPLFVMVFGEEWKVAGQYAAILAPYMLLQFTSSPLVQVLNVVGSQFLFLAINFFRILGFVFIWVGLGFYEVSAEGLVFLLGGYLFVFYGVVTLLIFIIINRISWDA